MHVIIEKKIMLINVFIFQHIPMNGIVDLECLKIRITYVIISGWFFF